MSTLRFDGRVAIVTGAGSGLGRSHALLLGARGARVVVNDMDETAAARVAAQIVSAGGDAFAAAGSVTDEAAVQRGVDAAMQRWHRVDILVNNAGVLRDRSFAKMSLEDFRLVVDVHLMGSVIFTKAVWEIMKRQRYGRIVMTTSSSGLYGNFGQANYGAAKMALVGLMQTLAIEGEKHEIRVNALAPTAATGMTSDIFPADELALLSPQKVSPGLLLLVGDEAPSRTILCAGAGAFAQAHVTLTKGIFVGSDADAPERLLAGRQRLADRLGEVIPGTGFDQARAELAKALVHTQPGRT